MKLHLLSTFAEIIGKVFLGKYIILKIRWEEEEEELRMNYLTTSRQQAIFREVNSSHSPEHIRNLGNCRLPNIYYRHWLLIGVEADTPGYTLKALASTAHLLPSKWYVYIGHYSVRLV